MLSANPSLLCVRRSLILVLALLLLKVVQALLPSFSPEPNDTGQRYDQHCHQQGVRHAWSRLALPAVSRAACLCHLPQPPCIISSQMSFKRLEGACNTCCAHPGTCLRSTSTVVSCCCKEEADAGTHGTLTEGQPMCRD